MRTLLLIIGLGCSTIAHANGLTFVDGAIRISGISSENRTVLVRDKSLAVVLPASKIQNRSIYPNHKIFKTISLYNRGSQTDLQIRFKRSAESVLPALQITQENEGLVIRLDMSKIGLPKKNAQQNLQTEKNQFHAENQPAILTTDEPGQTNQAKQVDQVNQANLSNQVNNNTQTKQSNAIVAANLVGKKVEKVSNISKQVSNKSKQTPDKSKITGLVGAAQTSGSAAIAMMLFVVALCVLAFWLRKKKKSNIGRTAIQIVATKSLSAKHRLVMVEVANEFLLLGCTEKDIHMIKTISCADEQNTAIEHDPTTVETGESASEKDESKENIFAKRLAKQLYQREKTANNTNGGDHEIATKKNFVNALNRIRKISSTGNTAISSQENVF